MRTWIRAYVAFCTPPSVVLLQLVRFWLAPPKPNTTKVQSFSIDWVSHSLHSHSSPAVLSLPPTLPSSWVLVLSATSEMVVPRYVFDSFFFVFVSSLISCSSFTWAHDLGCYFVILNPSNVLGMIRTRVIPNPSWARWSDWATFAQSEPGISLTLTEIGDRIGRDSPNLNNVLNLYCTVMSIVLSWFPIDLGEIRPIWTKTLHG